MTDKYAVIGYPIEHSKSPIIHAAFAKQTQQDISYEAILAPLDGFNDTVSTLIADGFQGVNVTVPFKVEAFTLANQIAPEALLAEASNTLIFDDQGIHATNTDGVGLVRDIEQNLNVVLKGKKVLLLGAGGAAQGVALPIVASQPALFVIANRTLEKAEAIAQKLLHGEHVPTAVHSASFEALGEQAFDVVINATSAGLSDTALPISNAVFAKSCLAYDMMYGRETPFMTQARNNGARVADGLGMLVEQAAEAFNIWRKVRPETQPVIHLLRNS